MKVNISTFWICFWLFLILLKLGDVAESLTTLVKHAQ